MSVLGITKVDEAFPIPDQFDGDWQQQLQRRRDLAALLRIDETSGNSIQNALIIGGPLITSALTLLIPARYSKVPALTRAGTSALGTDSENWLWLWSALGCATRR